MSHFRKGWAWGEHEVNVIITPRVHEAAAQIGIQSMANTWTAGKDARILRSI
jgi:hypothetical protein